MQNCSCRNVRPCVAVCQTLLNTRGHEAGVRLLVDKAADVNVQVGGHGNALYHSTRLQLKDTLNFNQD